ncbi:MAG: alpha/beta hydrolase [bacterium]|nr:alpha/beta hydrolase [bacterium]
MKKIEINTHQLGEDGPPLVMLHGWGQSLDSLLPLGELLANGASVHLVDLPGFGASPPPETDWDTAQYADCVLQYLDERQLAQVDLVGHSFGARIAIRLAAGHGERVRSLILIGAAGLPPRLPLRQRLRRRFIRIIGRLLKGWIEPLVSESRRRRLGEWYVERFGSADYRQAGRLRGTLVKVVTEDLTEVAARIRVPALLIYGDLDRETPVEIGRRFEALIAGAELVELPGKDHFPFKDSGAHLCAHLVRRFLRGPFTSGRDADNITPTT